MGLSIVIRRHHIPIFDAIGVENDLKYCIYLFSIPK